MKDFLKNNWQIILFEMLVITAFFVFYGKFGDMFVDSFREAYIPWQMNEGKCLYKDIFCIYPPLAYIINAILFKIFGAGINVLYFMGLLTTMGIFFLTYKISDMFLDKYTTFGTLAFILAGLVLSPNVFNSFFPYSYGMIYGLLFATGSIYCLINKKYPFAYLLYSLAICSKYEFILLLPLMIFVTKKTVWKKNLIALLLPPVVILTGLILTGTSFENIKTSVNLIGLMGQTDTLHFFYSSMGLIFRWEHLSLYLINFFKFILPFNWNLYQEVIMWIFPLILILFLIRNKTLEYREKILVAAALLVSIKVFFALTIQSYGVYFIPFALIALGILTPKKIKIYYGTLLIIWSVIIGFQNCNSLYNKDFSELYKTADYISATSDKSTVAVYPEGLGVNFISKRNGDSKFYSLIPLYVETFGEDIVIKRLELTKPEYIIINDFDTSAYYFKSFGKDYAKDIFNWVKKNYTLEKRIKNKHSFDIYKFNT